MAGEIIVGTRSRAPERTLSLLFLYPISTPTQVGGANVVVTPSTGIPTEFAGLVTAQEIAAFDAGTAAFEPFGFDLDDVWTTEQAIARAQAIYAARRDAFAAQYTRRFVFYGARVDAGGGA